MTVSCYCILVGVSCDLCIHIYCIAVVVKSFLSNSNRVYQNIVWNLKLPHKGCPSYIEATKKVYAVMW